ncbi:hypothetical protein GCM10027089_19870 [Nocardia thraciensis]
MVAVPVAAGPVWAARGFPLTVEPQAASPATAAIANTGNTIRTGIQACAKASSRAVLLRTRAEDFEVAPIAGHANDPSIVLRTAAVV